HTDYISYSGRLLPYVPTVYRQENPMAVVGNARTSTWRQDAGLDAQRMALEAYGCAKLFAEQVSSATVRPTLERALDYVREGDVFVVTKIDRLARSVADLCAIIAR